jgi:hypothetical protein
VLFDLPHVTEKAAGMASNRLALCAGDFFEAKLPACDAYVLMEVIQFATASPMFWGKSVSLSESPEPEPPEPISMVTAAKPAQKGWRVLSWPVLLLVALVALFTLWIVARRSSAGPATTGNSASPGVAPEDVRMIPGIERLRLATAEDFDPGAISWLRGLGQQVSGKIVGVYSGARNSSAYIFVDKNNARRAVIMAYGEASYNAEYPVIAVALRIPKELIQKISWADPSPPESDGDGLLIVRAADAPASGVVLFLRGTRVVSGNPSDYRQIPLGQAP